VLELIKVEKGKDQKNTIGGSSLKLVDIVEAAIRNHVLTPISIFVGTLDGFAGVQRVRLIHLLN